mgnify:CR=1 FL=1
MAKGFKSLETIIQSYADRAHQLSLKTAKAGILEGEYEDGTKVAYVAAIHEYGSPERKIPPRSYFRPAISEHQKEWADSLHDGVKAVVSGNMEAELVLDAVGAVAAADIKEHLSKTVTPPLSPITVMLRGMKGNDADLVVTGKTVGEAAKRVADGKTNYGASDKPLQDTYTLFDSINHSVDE